MFSVLSLCLHLYWGLMNVVFCCCLPCQENITILFPRLNEGGSLRSVSSNINTLTTTELIIKNCDLSNYLNCLLYVTFYLFREVLIHVKSA